jgi:hypothetical protein
MHCKQEGIRQPKNYFETLKYVDGQDFFIYWKGRPWQSSLAKGKVRMDNSPACTFQHAASKHGRQLNILQLISAIDSCWLRSQTRALFLGRHLAVPTMTVSFFLSRGLSRLFKRYAFWFPSSLSFSASLLNQSRFEFRHHHLNCSFIPTSIGGHKSLFKPYSLSQ